MNLIDVSIDDVDDLFKIVDEMDHAIDESLDWQISKISDADYVVPFWKRIRRSDEWDAYSR